MDCQSWERLPDPALSGKALNGPRQEAERDGIAGSHRDRGNKMGLRHAPAAKASFCEDARGSVKRVNEPALASLLLWKCFLFPSRCESKNLPLPCRPNQDHMAELCFTHTCAHPRTNRGLGLSDKLLLLLSCSVPSLASPWAHLILAQLLPSQ